MYYRARVGFNECRQKVKSRPVSLVRFAWTCIVLIIIMIMSAGCTVTMAFVLSICDLNYSSHGKEIELKKMLQIKRELSINIKQSSNTASQLFPISRIKWHHNFILWRYIWQTFMYRNCHSLTKSCGTRDEPRVHQHHPFFF